MKARALILAALLSLALAGCNRAVEGNPDAPGRPGTSNSPGSDPEAGGPGTQSGVGLGGGRAGTSGLGMTGSFPTGTATQSSGAGIASAGSPNRTPRSGVGTR